MSMDNFKHSCQAVAAIVHGSLPCRLSNWLSKLTQKASRTASLETTLSASS
jgi:hypothetical protein